MKFFLKVPTIVIQLFIISTLILWAASSLRHILLQSTAFDLGCYDQALYLISQGQPSYLSLCSINVPLGGHLDLIVYWLALLYKIYPTVYWLFLIQAISLSSAIFPIWYLANLIGLDEEQANLTTIIYLLYPAVFNTNLFDFHPEVIAIPFILTAILAARLHHIGWFIVCLIIIVICRASLSLNLIMTGIWLFFSERLKLTGIIAIIFGTAWFIIATKMIIPAFNPNGVSAVARFSYLGTSIFQIAQNLIIRPDLVIQGIFTLPNIEYIILLISPIWWGISLLHLLPLTGATPTLAINLLTTYLPQKDLVHHYSIILVPFFILVIIETLAAGRYWIKNQKIIIIWSLIAFIALAKFGYFGFKYLRSINTLFPTYQAISLIKTKAGVLTNPKIAPHLTQRPLIQLVEQADLNNLNPIQYILLDINQPQLLTQPDKSLKLVQQLKNHPSFTLEFQQNQVYLFTKKTTTPSETPP